MKKFLLAALAAIFVMGGFSVVQAGPPDGLWETLSNTARTNSAKRGYGNALAVTAGNTTFATADFGFVSNYVTLCFQAGGTVGNVVYYRLGASPTVQATNSADFIAGNTTVGIKISGRAFVLSGSGDGTDQKCQTHPYHTDGIVFHAIDTTATVDVTAH